jgi:hypothetical protein
MPKLNNATPEYGKHKASGQAVVTISGRDRYLGPHGTRASKVEYDRLIGEWLASGRPDGVPTGQYGLTIVELCQAYWKFARDYYSKNGDMTSNVYHVRQCLKHLKQNYGHIPAEDFGPLALKPIRSQMIDAGQARIYLIENIDRC